MKDNEFEFDGFDDIGDDGILEDLYEVLRRVPKNTILVMNVPRLIEVQKAITIIKNTVMEDYPDAQFKAYFDDLIGTTLLFEVRAEGLNVYDTNKFAEALAIANTMDVNPLDDDMVEIGFTFCSVRVPCKPDPKKK